MSVSWWIIGVVSVAVIMAIGAIGLVTMGPVGQSENKMPSKEVAKKKIISIPISDHTSQHEAAPVPEKIGVNLDRTDAVSNKTSNAEEISPYSQIANEADGEPSQTPTDQNNSFSTIVASQDSGQKNNSFQNLGGDKETSLKSESDTSQQSPSEEPVYHGPEYQDSGQEKTMSGKLQSQDTGSPQSEQSSLTDEKSVAQASISHDLAVQSPSIDNTGSSGRKDSVSATKPLAVNRGFEQTALFTVQVGVFRNHYYASRQTDQLRQRGYLSFIQEIIGLDGQPLYLVCFGQFMTQKETLAAVNEFKTREEMDAVVASLKSP